MTSYIEPVKIPVEHSMRKRTQELPELGTLAMAGGGCGNLFSENLTVKFLQVGSED